MDSRLKKNNQSRDKIKSNSPINISELWKNKQFLYPLSMVLILTAVIYSRTLENEILSWDDHWHITYNADIHSLSTKNIKTIFSSYYSNMYHPLVTLSFAIEYELFGLNPTAYHATNVLFHLGNIILVFFLTLCLSRRREIAIIAACLFGIHPMHVESVAWITERKDVLYAFFYLSGLILYYHFVLKGEKKYYWITILFFLLSLFSKATAITFPAAILLLDYYLGRKINRKFLIEKIPLFVMSIIFSIVSLHTQSDTTSFEIFEQFNLTDRFFFASYSICYYLIHLFVPINLSAFHSMPEKYQGYLPIDYYLAVIPIIFLILIGFKKSKLQKEYIFGIAFFLISLSLNIHIIPFGKAIVAERYTYLPYIGIYYLIGQTYCYFIERFQSLLHLKKVIYLIGTCVVIVFGFITFQRIAVWKNTLTLFDDASLKANSTKEAVTIQALGFILEAENKTNARKYTEAIELYDRAILLNPQRVESYSNRGIAKHCLLDYEGAMKDYSKAIELNPSFSRAYANRAAIHLVQNRLSEACSDLRKAYDLGLTGVLPTIQANCY